jgi:uncharacterized protein YbjT (DUF2867 family)
MTEKKLIAVVGATGSQGGGLVRAILEDPTAEFAVRALTRNPDSAKAKALADAGAEVVAADLDDEASMRAAFEGAHGAFVVTNYWAERTPEQDAAQTRAEMELAQAETAARAAKEAGIAHLIWSTLEDTRPFFAGRDDVPSLDDGRYKVPHFDAKGEADLIFRIVGVPTTFLLTAFYWENLIHFGAGPQKGPDGRLAIAYPMDDKKLPSIAVEDIGKAAYAIFQRGDEFINRTVGIAGEHLSGSEMAAALSRALGREIAYNPVTPETYRGFGFPGADDLGNMFQFKRDFNDYFCGARDMTFARSLVPDLQSYEQWLARHKDQIPIPAPAPAPA